ncbi:MAG: PAS domain S-box protein [Lutibacter sp.]|nr:PAS domain S-box protein [Lutibacter sp.]MBI9041114.1 PAS domain S-box protein [Lutibacter sp.]
MQVFLANTLYFEVYPTIFVSSGSSVIFTGSIFAILLIYIKEDAIEARKAIYGILAANIILSLLQFSISIGLKGDKVLNVYNLPVELFNQNYKISIIGTLLIFLDSFLIIFVFEIISKKIQSIFFRILFSSLFILSIDSVLFAVGAFYGTDQVNKIIISGLISKSYAAILYAIFFTIYLKHFDKTNLKLDAKGNVLKDIFHSLTFRQKYEKIYAKSIQQEEELIKSEQKHKYFVEQTNEGFFKMEAEIPIPINLSEDKQIELMYRYLFISECNENFAKMRGYKNKEEIIGTKLKDLQGNKNEDVNFAALSKFIQSNYITLQTKTIGLDKNKNERHFLNNTIGIIENDKLLSFWGTQSDVTDKINAEIALEEANTIINRSQSVAFLWRNEENWPVEFVSENIVKLTGYEPKDFINKTISYADIIYADDKERIGNEVKIASSNLTTTNFNHQPYRIITKDKTIKWVQDESYIRRNKNNEITHFEGVVIDITEKINANIQLVNEKNKAQNYLNVAGVMLVSIDSKGIVQLINPKGCEILGYSENEIIGKNWFDNFLPKDEIHKIKEISNLIYKGKIEHVKYIENEILTKNGDKKLIAWTNVLILDLQGNITSTLSSGEDITERNKIQEKLKINEEKYRTLFEYAPEGILIATTESYYLDTNTAMCKMLGYTRKELIGLHATDIVQPLEINNIQPALDTINSSKPYEKEWQFRRKDGTSFSAEVTVTTLPDGNLLALVKDVTEQKLLKANLIQEKELLKVIINNIPVMLSLYDPNINMLFLNNEFETKLGITTKDADEMDIMELFYPDEKIRKQVADFMLNAPKEWREFPISTKNGTILNTEWTNIKLDNGTQIGIGLDITERKLIQKNLIRFNNRLQVLNNVNSTILLSKDLNSIVENILLELQKTIHYKRASFGAYDSESNTFKMLSVIVEEKASKPLISKVEASKFIFIELDKLKSGEHQIIEDISALKSPSPIITTMVSLGLKSVLFVPLISNEQLSGILSLYSDSDETFSQENIDISKEIANQLAIAVNQHKLKNEILEYTENLEEKIKERTEQLEFSNKELRDFAQIVSHDLKAPLRAISQLSYWVSQDYSDKIDAAGQEQLAMLVGRVKRLDNLIEGILQYSRAGKAREKEVLIDLNTIVDDVIISLNPDHNIHIKVETDLPKILADPTRFSQVFQNLIANAIKFNDKPIVNITIGCIQKEDIWEFYISDNGPGIEEKYFDRIIQIFQRLETRDNQEGTGVGLSLVKKIIQIYNGEIWITSKINKGTTFHFTLPIKI